MITALIIDDEQLAREGLKLLLSKTNAVDVLGEAFDGIEGIEKINELSPDLIFLDVSMPEVSGFELLAKLNVKPYVIFTTAYSHYALQAFKENAIDYLLKPIQLSDLMNAIEKVKQQKQNKLLQYEIIEKLADPNFKKHKTKFLFEKGSKFYPVKTDEIAFFYSKDKVVTAYLFNGQKFICDESLDKLEEECDPNLYFRGNRQIILGHKSIKEIHNWYKGRLKITLNIPFEEEVFISAEKSSLFKAWLRE